MGLTLKDMLRTNRATLARQHNSLPWRDTGRQALKKDGDRWVQCATAKVELLNGVALCREHYSQYANLARFLEGRKP